MSIHSIILAAGKGTRLAGTTRGLPKCLLEVGGETILNRQIRALREKDIVDITVVVGYEADLVASACPGVRFVENPDYACTNTAKSLLVALQSMPSGSDVLWMNGDVLFDAGALDLILGNTFSVVGVNHEKCGDEEVKYRTDSSGCIVEISKTVTPGEGEALGINLILKDNVAQFIECLQACDNADYFERGLELAIERGLNIRPVSLAEFRCLEVDFDDDLARAKKLFGKRTVELQG